MRRCFLAKTCFTVHLTSQCLCVNVCSFVNLHYVKSTYENSLQISRCFFLSFWNPGNVSLMRFSWQCQIWVVFGGNRSRLHGPMGHISTQATHYATHPKNSTQKQKWYDVDSTKNTSSNVIDLCCWDNNKKGLQRCNKTTHKRQLLNPL